MQTKSEQLNELFTALAKAQAEMLLADMDSNNPFFKSKYADLASLVKASRPSLTKYGLSVVQYVHTTQEGTGLLKTMLGHSSGQWIESAMPIHINMHDPKSIQALGSALTYLRRYSYAAIVGVIATQEDDDGEAAVSRPLLQPKKIEGNYVSVDQLEELERELHDHPDIAKMILEKYGTLANMPKSQYFKAIDRIREIKSIKTK